ncbi:alpha/beta fold hydrolase [Pseudonocardia sp. TRM90224]|uniref:alpha/beta fold hydrolase n=1 Tax=Pseudonocardia sp. TRM90224 TaxID=2812678 RepID=UPI001E5B3D09|nr:alpha/beta hydrolase [Pseudonocardia sp. TRM90224]
MVIRSTVPAPPAAALRAGTGEPVLLLHPYSLSHHVWRDVAADLASTYDVYAPTLPGHWGGPPLHARDVDITHLTDGVERLLDEAGWDTCHVVGNSLGGWLAFELARRGRARSVTGIAPAGGWASPSLAQLAIGGRFLAAYPGIVALTPRATRDVVLRRTFLQRAFMRTLSYDASAVAPTDVDRLVESVVGCRGYLPLLWSVLRNGAAVRLDGVHCPAHLVLCDEDTLIPPRRYSALFLDQLHDARVTRLPGVGHVPMLENPQLVATTIRAFLTTVIT